MFIMQERRGSFLIGKQTLPEKKTHHNVLTDKVDEGKPTARGG